MTVFPFHDTADLAAALAEVAECLGLAGVVLLPTETFYGLAADPFSQEAVANVLRLKGRPENLPLPVLAADWDQVDRLAIVSCVWRGRLEAEWPGPMTAVLPSRVSLPASPGGSVAVRIPQHLMLRKLLLEVGPLTGTSANCHGRQPAVDIINALQSLLGEPTLVLDGGKAPGGLPSTIVDLTGEDAKILRQGVQQWAAG